MPIITAKELRANLSEYLDRIEAGEEFEIFRRSHVVGRLQPSNEPAKGNGSEIVAAIKHFQRQCHESEIKVVAPLTESSKSALDAAIADDAKYAGYLPKSTGK